MINEVILSGNVGQDPKTTTFQDGSMVVNFSLATTERGYKTQDGREIPDKTDWHNIVVRRKGLTTLASQYLHKGDKVNLVGKLTYRSYERDGVKHTVAEVVVGNLEILSPKSPAVPEPSNNGDPF